MYDQILRVQVPWESGTLGPYDALNKATIQHDVDSNIVLDSCLIKRVTGSECPGSTLASMSKMWRCLQILQAHRRSCEMLENLHKEYSAGSKRI